MTKNWIGYATGSWINAQHWQEDGFCAFDPAAVISMRRWDSVPGCTIYFTNGKIHVSEVMDAVIARIQEAL